MNELNFEEAVPSSVFDVAQLDPSQRLEIVKQHLRNLGTSYSDQSDLFTELIQNAIDSCTSEFGRPEFSTDLTVVLGRRDRNSHYLYVQDAGSGMAPEVVNNIFKPGFSLKRQGEGIGHKGVGVSFVAAISDHLAVRTVDENGTRTDLTLKGISDWVNDSEAPLYTVQETFEAPEVVQALASEIVQGTGVYFKFHSGSMPQSLSNLVLVSDIDGNAEVLEWANYLCAKTPLGLAVGLGEESILSCRIVLDRGDGISVDELFKRDSYDFQTQEKHLGYPFPSLVIRQGTDTEAIDSTPPARQQIDHGRQHKAVWHQWPISKILESGIRLEEDERSHLEESLLWAYGWYGYKTSLLDDIRKKMGTRSQVIRYGTRLVVDGVPQARPLELTLTSNQGIERQVHIVLAFKDIDLDTGRKMISNETLLSGTNKIGRWILDRLIEYRAFMVPAHTDEPAASQITSWINQMEAKLGISVISRTFQILPDFVPPLRVDPTMENEVIALWGALNSIRMLQGFETEAISGNTRYDALVNISDQAVVPQEATPENPFGYLSAQDQRLSVKNHAVFEFKVLFSSVIEDFVSRVKFPSEVDVVVCWDLPTLTPARGTLKPTYGPWRDQRQMHAASYVWRDSEAVEPPEFQIICLRNVLAEVLAETEGGTRDSLDTLIARDRDQAPNRLA